MKCSMDTRAIESGESRYERQVRSSVRLPMACRAQWVFNDVGRVGTTRDLSTAGLFLPTPTPLAAGTVVELNLTLDEKRTPVRVGARVVRSVRTGRHAGMALAFTGHRAEVAQTEVASFLLQSLEAQARHGESTAPSPPPEAVADRDGSLHARERDLANRARTFERVIQAVQAERQRLLVLEEELRHRQEALNHREACLERLNQSLAEREARMQSTTAEVTMVMPEVTRPDL
jgi:hypothetical protein